MSSECCSTNDAGDGTMDLLFRPRGVAVIGASSNPGKIGYRIVANMVASGYDGRIVPINPKGGEVDGIPVLKSLADAEGPIDVAVISIPAPLVADTVRSCGEAGVRHLVIVTSGFSEVGNTEDERDIVRVAREYGMRVLGPNIFGVYSAKSAMDATFGPGGIEPGHVAIVTQSGALGIAMIGKTAGESLGLSALVSVGNKSDIDEADLLGYLADDEATRVILLYIEGVKAGDRLVRALRETTRRKHVVVIKSGRSQRGAMAAASHTGSLAGADDVFDDVMRQCGVLRAESVQEAFNWVRFLSSAPLPSGRDAVIITNGGGIGVLATDACEKHDVALFDDQLLLKETFSGVMPDFGSSKNPVDLTGQASADDYRKALDAARVTEGMDATIALYCETGLFNTAGFSALLRETYAQYETEKPIVFSLFGGERVERLIRDVRRDGIPVFGDVYEAVSALGALYSSWNHRRQPADEGARGGEAALDLASVRDVLQKAGATGRGFLLPQEAAVVADVLGLSLPTSRIARTLDDAVRLANEIGYPVVMKIVSKDIIHKSDAGGVAVDLENDNEVVDAYQAILQSCRAAVPDAVIDGVEIVEMVSAGVETIVGARQDGSFGPVVMFGLGGIYVEVMKDVAFRAAPIDEKTANRMIGDIRAYPLLLGVRGESRKDIDSIAAVLVRLSQLIAQCPEITDIEINPLVVYDRGQGVKAVDVRILFSVPKGVK